MKTIALVAALTLAAVAPTLAEQGSRTPASEPQAEHGELGKTGWSGGQRNQDAAKGQAPPARQTTTSAPESGEQQPEVATGVDLKGPPTRFSAKNTPE